MYLYLEHGSNWCKLIKYLPGRTRNQTKNRFNSFLKKHYVKDKFEELIETYKIRIRADSYHDAIRYKAFQSSQFFDASSNELDAENPTTIKS